MATSAEARPVLEKSMKSYVSEYASAARSSRVATAPRALSQITRIALLAQIHNPPRPVLSVVVNPSGDHVGALDLIGYAVLTAGGGLVQSGSSRGRSLQLLESGYLLGGQEQGFSGPRRGIGIDAQRGIEWAILVDAPRLVYVVAQREMQPLPHEATGASPAKIKIASEELDPSNPNLKRTLWTESFLGTGTGAIAADYRVAVALRNGRFYVFDARPKPPGSTHWGHTLVDVPIDFSPYDMSIVESGYAILAAGDPIDKPTPRTESEQHIALEARRIEGTGEPPARWKTVLHHLGPDGIETFRHEVPFEVLQPPIDAGNGRIYLMGQGTAAFQDGKLLFLTASPTPMFGTAFADGTMAIAAGFELRIVGADGKVRQTFTTGEREAITAPPAIGSDGAVWLGTEKAIYVVR